MKKLFVFWYNSLPPVEFWITQTALAVVGFVFLGIDPTGAIGLTGLGFASVAMLASALSLLLSLAKAIYKTLSGKSCN